MQALELLEIDENNFKEALALFTRDYAFIRKAIKKAGLTDDSVVFYNLFDCIADIGERDGFAIAVKIAQALKPEHIQEINRLQSEHKGFQVLYSYTPGLNHSEKVSSPWADDARHEKIIDREENLAIQIVPPNSTGTLLVSGWDASRVAL